MELVIIVEYVIMLSANTRGACVKGVAQTIIHHITVITSPSARAMILDHRDELAL
jgi:hypothetical protein